MTFYLVRGENGGEPESYTFGLYKTEKDAMARIKSLREEGEDFEYMWYDELTVGEDVFLSNR